MGVLKLQVESQLDRPIFFQNPQIALRLNSPKHTWVFLSYLVQSLPRSETNNYQNPQIAFILILYQQTCFFQATD